MTHVDKEMDAVKRGTAILCACLAASIGDEGKARFVENLEQAYAKMRDEPHHKHLLEMISWTRELVTGFSLTEGQGKPFLP
jgi:hypothetical protein